MFYDVFCVFIFNRKSKTCPSCRAKTEEKDIHQLYLTIEDAGVDFSVVLTRLSDVEIAITKKEEKSENLLIQVLGAVEALTKSMSAFERQNEALKTENAQLKQSGFSSPGINNDSSSSSTKEQLKAKDFMIANLQVELCEIFFNELYH